MLAWNNAEAGKILETYKIYENKPPDMIMEKTGKQANSPFIPLFCGIKFFNFLKILRILLLTLFNVYIVFIYVSFFAVNC